MSKAKNLFEKLRSTPEKTETMVEAPPAPEPEAYEAPVTHVEPAAEPVAEEATEKLADVAAHNKKLPAARKHFEREPAAQDANGLEGNPGQQHRYARVMENKHEGVSKYFWSGGK